MPSEKKQPQIPLPKSWDKYVKSGILHVFALAQYALIYSRSWAADSSNQRVRLKAERDRWEQEAAQLREAMRIKDARMALIAPQRRPHYPATERMAIRELRCCPPRHSGLSCASSRHSLMRRCDTGDLSHPNGPYKIA